MSLWSSKKKESGSPTPTSASVTVVTRNLWYNHVLVTTIRLTYRKSNHVEIINKIMVSADVHHDIPGLYWWVHKDVQDNMECISSTFLEVCVCITKPNTLTPGYTTWSNENTRNMINQTSSPWHMCTDLRLNTVQFFLFLHTSMKSKSHPLRSFTFVTRWSPVNSVKHVCHPSDHIPNLNLSLPESIRLFDNKMVVGYREVWECEGWVCECEDIGVPPMLRLIRSALVLTRMLPTLDLSWRNKQHGGSGRNPG